MKYPKEVQEKIDILNAYAIDNNLTKFNIFHLYSKELAFSNGFRDSRFFELVGFNTELSTKRNLDIHDGIMFLNDNHTHKIKLLRVFADGAFLVRFSEPIKLDFPLTQEVLIS